VGDTWQLRVTPRVRVSTRSGLDVRASDIAIHLRPRDGIGYHVTATMGPREARAKLEDRKVKQTKMNQNQKTKSTIGIEYTP
jgi:hypothetical protein